MSALKGKTQEQVAREFEQIMRERFQKQQDNRGIGVTGALRSSFDAPSEITLSGDGDVKRIEKGFERSGRFVDMGVGKGVSLSDVAEDRSLSAEFRNPRRPKKWYSPTFAAEAHSFAEIFAKYFGVQGISFNESSAGVIPVNINPLAD